MKLILCFIIVVMLIVVQARDLPEKLPIIHEEEPSFLDKVAKKSVEGLETGLTIAKDTFDIFSIAAKAIVN